MNKDEFIQLYWRNYILLEKEFVQTLTYVTLDEENYNAFSSAYIKILLQIGSEIDIVAKELCGYYNSDIKVKNINDYKRVIQEYEKDFCNTKVVILNRDDLVPVAPWGRWGDLKVKEGNEAGNPSWWKVYNMVKHRRIDVGKIDDVEKEYYKFANLKYTLFALEALYQLLIYFYYNLASEDRIKVPVPGSHLFALSGNRWDEVEFYQDLVFFIEDYHLHYCSGAFVY